MTSCGGRRLSGTTLYARAIEFSGMENPMNIGNGAMEFRA